MSGVAPGALVEVGRYGRVARPERWIRSALRQTVPFAWRVGLRRLPALFVHLRASSPPVPRDRAAWAHIQAERSSPLRRPGADYPLSLQRAKEQNVRRVVKLIDGTLVGPGAQFSWHRWVGPPMRLRGFAAGPELHGDALAAGSGGGVCQVSNLLYYLALHAGMQITERHRHHLDLFPDTNRDVPFGCGATVFFPWRDLRFINPANEPLLLDLSIRDGILVGRARLRRDPGFVWEVVQTGHRFVRRADGVWRENRLVRQRTGADGGIRREWIAENRARVTYPVPTEEIEEE